MNPDTMTVTELADWCADDDGAYFSMDRELGPIGWCDKDGKIIGDHPYQPNLTDAAKSVPQGWFIRNVSQYQDGWDGAVHAKDAKIEISRFCPDLMTLLYRLGVKARIAAKGVKA